MTDVYIALGSNLGDRRRAIACAIRRIHELPSTKVVRVSSIIETDPVGPPGQGAYMNAMVHAQTQCDPRALLDQLLSIELDLGRDRSAEAVRWGPRTIDLDIILFGDRIIDEEGLQIPHPRMRERTFVLVPLVEIAPEIKIAPDRRTPRELLDAIRGV